MNPYGEKTANISYDHTRGKRQGERARWQGTFRLGAQGTAPSPDRARGGGPTALGMPPARQAGPLPAAAALRAKARAPAREAAVSRGWKPIEARFVSTLRMPA